VLPDVSYRRTSNGNPKAVVDTGKVPWSLVSFQTKFRELAPEFRGNGTELLTGVDSWTVLNGASTFLVLPG
jgi:hypothetical protein